VSTSSINPERWKQIEDLYQAACDLDASDRARLLAAADSDLRRTVESLLAQPTGEGPLRGVAADLVHDHGGQRPLGVDRAQAGGVPGQSPGGVAGPVQGVEHDFSSRDQRRRYAILNETLSRFETSTGEVGYGMHENMLIGVYRPSGFLTPDAVAP
jgi:hypothetical protein